MARRRFAGISAGAGVTLIKTIAVALCAMAATSLGGCAAYPPHPFSVEEQLWFDKATGSDITRVPPGLRMREAVGYWPPVHRIYRGPPPPLEVEEP
jgi:hypothetical protein